MLEANVEKVLAAIRPGDRVLDVGGWACPFNRADWVLDAMPWSTRGYYAQIGLPRSQGGEREHFSESTWVTRDICDRAPWPFADQSFDFSICSHTLEDVRDPLYVCSEVVRVSKRGYIEVPSRLIESCRGIEDRRWVGLSHHRWLVDVEGDHLQFTMKYHLLHGDFDLSLPRCFAQQLSNEACVSFLFWQGGLTYAETVLHGMDEIYAELRRFVARRHTYPRYRYGLHRLHGLFGRALSRLQRRWATAK